LESIQVKRSNSAVFNGGLLTGGDYCNYQAVSRQSHPELFKLFKWRAAFYDACNACNVLPQEAAAIFANRAHGVKSNALSTTNPKGVLANAEILKAHIPEAI